MLVKISLYGVLYILVWFRAGLGFEYHIDDNANLLDRLYRYRYIDINLDIDI